VQIRVAEERDAPVLEREFLRFVSRDFNEARNYAIRHLKMGRTMLMLEDGRYVQGMLHWGWGDTIDDGVAQITGGRVLPTQRNRGIGSRLLEAGLADIQNYYAEQDRQLRQVFAIIPDTPEARRLFEKYGFQCTGEIPRHRPDGTMGVFYVWEPPAQFDSIP